MPKNKETAVEVLPKTQTQIMEPPKPPSGPPEGFENMDQGDMAKPRLALCQSQTPQRLKEDPKYIKGLEEGQFFNTITGQIYGEVVKFTPLMFFKYRLRFGKQDFKEEAGKLLCQSENARIGMGDPGGDCFSCPMASWTEKSPRCMLLYGYAGLVIPPKGELRIENLAVVSLKSANMGLAKDWNAMMRLRQGDNGAVLPMYQGIYELASVKKKFNLGSAFMIIPKNAGQHSPDSLNYKIARTSYYLIQEMYATGRLKVDAEDMGREPGE